MLTVAATWSRPTARAPAVRRPNDARGSARASSNTIEACEVVTSSSTPSPPSTIPASSSPRKLTPPTSRFTRRASSDDSPVRLATWTTTHASPTVSASASAVPTTAAVVLGDGPWDRYSVAIMIATPATSATATGSWPARIDGTRKTTISTADRASPSSARSPCQRPNSSTARTKAPASTASGSSRRMSLTP